MATYRITNGTAAGAHEVYFDGKPSEAVREALKGLKMRWNHKKVCWYGFSDESAIISAIQHSEAAVVRTDGYIGGGATYGGKSYKGGDTLENIRADFKAAGLKGVTARNERGGYTYRYTFTIKATAADILPLEDFIQLYELKFNGHPHIWVEGLGKIEFNEYHRMAPEEQVALEIKAATAVYNKWTQEMGSKYGRDITYNQVEASQLFTQEFNFKVRDVFHIVKSYHWDETNAMVDYFSTNFYYSIRIKSSAVEA